MFKKAISYLLYCYIFFQFSACGNRPDGVLNQRDMKDFLTDLHLLDAVLDEKPLANERERVYYYNALLQKHSITKAEFDSSLVYYTKNPKLFERIYSGVVKNLEKFQSEVKEGKYFPILPDSIRLKPLEQEIWSSPIAYNFTKDSIRRQLAFSVRNYNLMTKDIYLLRFLLRVAPQDSSKNTYAALKIHYVDGKVDSLTHKTYNDSVLRRYAFRFRASRNVGIDSLSGIFYGSSRYAGVFNIKVDSISLKRVYVPALQDSLRLQLDTIVVKVKVADTVPAVIENKPQSLPKPGKLKKERKLIQQ
jgi:hypothetical protein